MTVEGNSDFKGQMEVERDKVNEVQASVGTLLKQLHRCAHV